MELSDRIREALKKSPDTMQNKAKALGVSRVTLYNYLNGRTKPKAEFVQKVAKLTGARLEWLFDGKKE